MRRSFLHLLGGVLFCLPLLFASCGNGDNALEEIIKNGGSGEGGSSSTVTDIEPYAANEFTEVSWNSTLGKVESTKKTADQDPVVVANSDADVTWNAGWYTVSGDVTITGNVTLGADTHLILQDGANLTINGRIDGSSGYNFYIYGQGKGDGKLNVTNSSNTTAIQIGNESSTDDKIIEIHGGEITAKATTSGSGSNGLFANGIKVYGGKLTATSAIAHGIKFTNHNTEITYFDVYGGEVEGTATSTGDWYSYGIYSNGNDILRVYGGKVKGTGNGYGDHSLYDHYGMAFHCKVQSGTTGIKFYFSDNGTSWDSGHEYSDATVAPTNRYAKAE